MEIKEKFLQYITVERRLSQKTVLAYSESLGYFAEFLAKLSEPRVLEDADSDNIRDWMESLMERKCSAAYVNRSLAALRTFYKFCYANGVVRVDPAHSVVGPKKPKRLPHFFKESEMENVFKVLDGEIDAVAEDDKFNVVRARTILYMLYLTGLRSAELISLDDVMIDVAKKELKVTGKRNKQRIIPFGQELQNVLADYVSTRDESVVRCDDALFVDDKGKRLTYNKVRLIVKNYMTQVSSLDRCSPHVLRHTFATTMLNHNANLESIKKMLGHQNLDTTQIYTHTSFEQLRKIYDEAHPRQ